MTPEERNQAALELYRKRLQQVNKMTLDGQCGSAATDAAAGFTCLPPDPPVLEPIPKVKRPKPMPAIDAAYLALATKLSIKPSGVGIGPEPELSMWKMAVVGHSYWLWADGPTHLGPVSDAQAGYNVTLDAILTGVTFELGDGSVLNCRGGGTPYPGDDKGLYAKSPTCGYTYAQTSRHQPSGRYTVRMITSWSVAYTTPMGSGPSRSCSPPGDSWKSASCRRW